MAVIAALCLTVAIFGGLIGKVISNDEILMGAVVNGLAGIGFAILSLRDIP